MSKKIDASKTRQTDWLKMDSLHYLADQKGMAVMSFSHSAEGWKTSYLKPAPLTEPKIEFCRDELDYTLKLNEWVRRCTVESKYYESFQDMILGEIESLKTPHE